MLLGTMPDFSQAKHIDLTDDVGSYRDGSLLASSFTNSFGDKIVYYRKLKVDNGSTHFVTVGVILYHEGNHPSFKEMLSEATRLARFA